MKAWGFVVAHNPRCDLWWLLEIGQTFPIDIFFNPSLAEHDMPCLSQQCRFRSEEAN